MLTAHHTPSHARPVLVAICGKTVKRYVHHNYNQKKKKKLADQTPREIWPVRLGEEGAYCNLLVETAF